VSVVRALYQKAKLKTKGSLMKTKRQIKMPAAKG
jgi:hypothetical protein